MSWCVACIVQVLGRMLRRGIRQAVLQLHGCREEQAWRDHIVQAEHEELLRQHGNQANALSEHWLGETNFPSLESQESSESPIEAHGTTTWAMVAGRHAVLSCTPGMPERRANMTRMGTCERPCNGDSTAVLAVGSVGKRAVRAPALVGGVSFCHKKKAFAAKQSRHSKEKPKGAAKNQVAQVPSQAPAVLQNEHQCTAGDSVPQVPTEEHAVHALSQTCASPLPRQDSCPRTLHLQEARGLGSTAVSRKPRGPSRVSAAGLESVQAGASANFVFTGLLRNENVAHAPAPVGGLSVCQKTQKALAAKQAQKSEERKSSDVKVPGRVPVVQKNEQQCTTGDTVRHAPALLSGVWVQHMKQKTATPPADTQAESKLEWAPRHETANIGKVKSPQVPTSHETVRT